MKMLSFNSEGVFDVTPEHVFWFFCNKHIYVAGPVSGMENYNRPAFERAEYTIKQCGGFPLSSLGLPEGMTQEAYMDICFAMIRGCRALYMLKGWEDSKGAVAEHAYAIKIGKAIVYEE